MSFGELQLLPSFWVELTTSLCGIPSAVSIGACELTEYHLAFSLSGACSRDEVSKETAFSAGDPCPSLPPPPSPRTTISSSPSCSGSPTKTTSSSTPLPSSLLPPNLFLPHRSNLPEDRISFDPTYDASSSPFFLSHPSSFWPSSRGIGISDRSYRQGTNRSSQG